jgi:hypothetical protein
MKTFSEFFKDKIKQPLKVTQEPCPDCGSNGTLIYYGTNNRGEEDFKYECDNPRCRSHEGPQTLSQFV